MRNFDFLIQSDFLEVLNSQLWNIPGQPPDARVGEFELEWQICYWISGKTLFRIGTKQYKPQCRFCWKWYQRKCWSEWNCWSECLNTKIPLFKLFLFWVWVRSKQLVWYNAYYIIPVVEREKVQSEFNLSKIA